MVGVVVFLIRISNRKKGIAYYYYKTFSILAYHGYYILLSQGFAVSTCLPQGLLHQQKMEYTLGLGVNFLIFPLLTCHNFLKGHERSQGANFMISERIFSDNGSLEEIINMILDQKIDFVFQQLYSEDKVNTAPSSDKKEDVVK